MASAEKALAKLARDKGAHAEKVAAEREALQGRRLSLFSTKGVHQAAVEAFNTSELSKFVSDRAYRYRRREGRGVDPSNADDLSALANGEYNTLQGQAEEAAWSPELAPPTRASRAGFPEYTTISRQMPIEPRRQRPRRGSNLPL